MYLHCARAAGRQAYAIRPYWRHVHCCLLVTQDGGWPATSAQRSRPRRGGGPTTWHKLRHRMSPVATGEQDRSAEEHPAGVSAFRIPGSSYVTFYCRVRSMSDATYNIQHRRAFAEPPPLSQEVALTWKGTWS